LIHTNQPCALVQDTDRSGILASLRERIVAFAASRYARDAAEDLAQEVLVVLQEKYSHLDRLEDLVPLSFQILRFKLVAWQRKAYRRGEYDAISVEDHPIASETPDAHDELERRELMEKLSTGLQMLGKRCQELFRHKLQGRNFIEIQGLMGAGTINTVYTWDSRCRKQLLEWMGGRWER